MTTTRSKLQPIRDFTVQVRNLQNEIVGTGFAVNAKPALIVTCRHVVMGAAGTCDIGTAVNIYLPMLNGDEQAKTFPAKVTRRFNQYDDDVVVLKLDVEQLPTEVKIAVIGDAKPSTNCTPAHGFRSYGFRELGTYQGAPAYGTIIDFTGKPTDKNLQTDPLLLQSQHIDGGMSGAAVLDMERNLVVGVVARKYKALSEDRDAGIAVDGATLAIAPLNLKLHPDYDYPLEPAFPPTDQAQKDAGKNRVMFPLQPEYNPAEPPPLPEWVGRGALLTQMTEDYKSPDIHVTGLIGFGGEGKSSLAYRWLKQIPDDHPPEAVFWWGFYDNRNFDAMLEAAIDYLYGDMADTWKSASGRVEAIGALLHEQRIVFVLDGFEVLQEEKSDAYGTINNRDIVRLLELFAQGDHKSYCLVTSRAPLLDLLSYSAYIQRDVTRLDSADGVQLLENLDVQGDKNVLKTIVKDWDGHALTVSLVGSYLRDVKQGQTDEYSKAMFPELDTYADSTERYRGVSRILRRYDEALTDAERAFLKLFSVFRLPVPESAFDRVFRTHTSDDALNTPLTGLSDDDFAKLVAQLQNRRLIRRNEDSYSTHPLVRNHYLRLLESDSKDTQNTAHKSVADHYQESNTEPGRFPTLEDLQPYIEVVYHLCRAGAYDEALEVCWQRIYQTTSYILTAKLGAYNTAYNTWLQFFPEGDTSKAPAVSKDSDKRFILNEIGFCLMNTGSLTDAAPFYERVTSAYLEAKNYHAASIVYRNLSKVYEQIGQLQQAAEAAAQSLESARQVTDEQTRKQDKRDSLAWQAWIDYLRGEMAAAGQCFTDAEVLECEIDPDEQYLYSGRGIWHATYLRRTGDADYARQISDANIEISTRNRWIKTISMCHRVLGDLDADAGNNTAAREHYETALTIARSIDRLDVLIEILIAYGRWRAVALDEIDTGKNMLNEALRYCTQSGYKLYEADARVALSEIALKEGDDETALLEAFRAKKIGEDTGYHWAQVDAQAVLDKL